MNLTSQRQKGNMDPEPPKLISYYYTLKIEKFLSDVSPVSCYSWSSCPQYLHAYGNI